MSTTDEMNRSWMPGVRAKPAPTPSLSSVPLRSDWWAMRKMLVNGDQVGYSSLNS
jgi:hypothetical protein